MSDNKNSNNYEQLEFNMCTQFGKITIEVNGVEVPARMYKDHTVVMTPKSAAKGFGISQGALRGIKRRNAGILEDGVHILKGSRYGRIHKKDSDSLHYDLWTKAGILKAYSLMRKPQSRAHDFAKVVAAIQTPYLLAESVISENQKVDPSVSNREKARAEEEEFLSQKSQGLGGADADAEPATTPSDENGSRIELDVLDETARTGNGPVSISTLEIAAITNKPHRNVLRDVRSTAKGLSGDLLKFEQIYFDALGRPQPYYQLPQRECMILMMSYSKEAAVAVFDKMMALRTHQISIETPQDLAQALRICADAVERLMTKAEIDSGSLAKLTEVSEKLEKANKVIKFQEPAVNFVDSMDKAPGELSLMEVAKSHKVCPASFFKNLLDRKILYRFQGSPSRVGSLVPYESVPDKRRFRITRPKIWNGKIREYVRGLQTVVTPKGEAWLIAQPWFQELKKEKAEK